MAAFHDTPERRLDQLCVDWLLVHGDRRHDCDPISRRQSDHAGILTFDYARRFQTIPAGPFKWTEEEADNRVQLATQAEGQFLIRLGRSASEPGTSMLSEPGSSMLLSVLSHQSPIASMSGTSLSPAAVRSYSTRSG